MFENKAVATFKEDGHVGLLIITDDMPVEVLQKISNKITAFCVKRIQDAKNEEAQKIKDEEALKAKELQEASKEEIETVEGMSPVTDEVKESVEVPQPVEA